MTGKLTFGIQWLRLCTGDRAEVTAVWSEVTASISKDKENMKGGNLG